MLRRFFHQVAGRGSSKTGLAGGSSSTGLAGLQQAVAKREAGIAGPHAELVWHGSSGFEAIQRRAPLGLAAAVRIEVDGRVPAAGHAHGVHRQPAGFAAGQVTLLLADLDGAHHGSATGLQWHITAQHADTGVLGLLCQPTGQRANRVGGVNRVGGAHIHHGDAGSGGLQREGVAIGAVVVGEQGNALPHQHAVELRVGRPGRC